MLPDFFDNKARIVKDDLVARIMRGDRLSVAASVFSMYAYRELSKQLEGLDDFRFIFTSDAFTASRPKREKREFYIPRLNRETKNGRDMRRQARLLRDAVGSIIEAKAQSDIDSFFGGGTTSFLENDVEGLDDFELVCFLAVRP